MPTRSSEGSADALHETTRDKQVGHACMLSCDHCFLSRAITSLRACAVIAEDTPFERMT